MNTIDLFVINSFKNAGVILSQFTDEGFLSKKRVFILSRVGVFKQFFNFLCSLSFLVRGVLAVINYTTSSLFGSIKKLVGGYQNK